MPCSLACVKTARCNSQHGPTIAQVDPRVPIFPLIQSHLKVNGLDVPKEMDLSKHEWFGILPLGVLQGLGPVAPRQVRLLA